VQNGLLLSNCIHLSFDSSYSASFDDGVVLEGMGTDTSGGYLMQSLGYNDLFSSPLASPTTKKQMAALGNCVIDIQAVAPEFTFYDTLERVECNRHFRGPETSKSLGKGHQRGLKSRDVVFSCGML
jgi:hypothetical protein